MEFQLRLLILIIGLLLIAVLFYFGTRGARRNRRSTQASQHGDAVELTASDQQQADADLGVESAPLPRATGEPINTPPRDEPAPVLAVDLHSSDSDITDPDLDSALPPSVSDVPVEAAEPRPSADAEPRPSAEPVSSQALRGKPLIVIMTVRAAQQQSIKGVQLLAALQEQRYAPNQRDTWDYYLDGVEVPLFSVGQLAEPGTLAITSMAELETPGLLLFTQLPRSDAMTSVQALERMLAAAQRLAQLLDGRLCDRAGNDLDQTRQQQLRAAAIAIDEPFDG